MYAYTILKSENVNQQCMSEDWNSTMRNDLGMKLWHEEVTMKYSLLSETEEQFLHSLTI